MCPARQLHLTTAGQQLKAKRNKTLYDLSCTDINIRMTLFVIDSEWTISLTVLHNAKNIRNYELVCAWLRNRHCLKYTFVLFCNLLFMTMNKNMGTLLKGLLYIYISYFVVIILNHVCALQLIVY